MVARTEGNQTTQFDYDYDNRLVKITYPDGSVVRFGYDGLGRRVFRQEGSNVRYFYYDGDRIIAEREGSSWVVRYLLGLRPCGFVANGQVRVYHADRLGSVRWVTDGSQNIVVSYIYEGFGKIVGQNGGGGGPYQFCGLWGYRNDWDEGLIHVGARYYEVETGRFPVADMWLGDTFNPQTLNRFVYGYNNPISFIDSSGYIPKWLKGIGVILVIGATIGAGIAGGAAVIVGGGSVILAGVIIGAGFVAGAGTYLWGFDEIVGIGEAIADKLFPPDERCCGGVCYRNKPPTIPWEGTVKFDPRYIQKLKSIQAWP